MTGLYMVLLVLSILLCGALVTVILLQKKRTSGIGSMAGMGNAQTYWDKNKGRSLEGTLEKYTKIGGALLFVLLIVICVLK